MSVRSKKIREIPGTPIAHLDRWNGVPDAGGSHRFLETPRRPKATKGPEIRPEGVSPDIIKRTLNLPGFENSFATSTPLRPSLVTRRRALHDNPLTQSPFPASIRPSPPSSPIRPHYDLLTLQPDEGHRPDMNMDGDNAGLAMADDNDVEMGPDDDERQLEDYDSATLQDPFEEVILILRLCFA